MYRLIGGQAWNRVEIEMPDVERISIGLPSAETVPTDTEQIPANILGVSRNMKKRIEFSVEIPPLIIVLLTINPDKTG
jgi:hypothetical protein